MACSSEEPDTIEPPQGPDAGVLLPVSDKDQDGLCDDTEAELGTDENAIDSDQDDLPDVLEVALGLNPLFNLSPDPSHLVHLQAVPGATTTFEPRLTIDGNGGSYMGTFESLRPFYQRGHEAASFLDGAKAVSAEPPDNIRALDAVEQRFVGVRGNTRLRFQLQFTYPLQDEVPCTIAHPFSYSVLEDGEGWLETPVYLLVLDPAGGQTRAEDFCKQTGCF